ncbi:MAG: hypothetical protein SFV32_09540 [Opitutaceae bacterium]|nr:hypothetical protein [Opitutaceae bacterium]
MASEPQQTVTVEQLMALRAGPDALRTISEALNVKRMGPADHIRTKHEVKRFLDSSDTASAEKLLLSASKRVSLKQAVPEKIAITQSQKQRP